MPLYLVRHGSAGVRNDTDPADDRRPLDDTGRLQARRIAAWLRHEPITALVASPFLRCVETLDPLADALQLGVITDNRLAEATAIDDAWGLVEEWAGRTAVFCSHGDVIPDVVRRAQLRGMEVPGKAGCSKASVWTLDHWDGTRFATGVYTPVRV